MILNLSHSTTFFFYISSFPSDIFRLLSLFLPPTGEPPFRDSSWQIPHWVSLSVCSIFLMDMSEWNCGPPPLTQTLTALRPWRRLSPSLRGRATEWQRGTHLFALTHVEFREYNIFPKPLLKIAVAFRVQAFDSAPVWLYCGLTATHSGWPAELQQYSPWFSLKFKPSIHYLTCLLY